MGKATLMGKATKRRGWLAGFAVGILVLGSGCGISATSKPADEGDPAVASSVRGGGVVIKPASGAAFTSSYVNIVESFFDAAAGVDVPGGDEEAVTRTTSFLTNGAKKDWQPGSELTVVRIIELGSPLASGGAYTVKVLYQKIGIMTPEGAVTEAGDQKTIEFVFRIEQQEVGWRLSRVPSGLMIRDAALIKYYQPSPVYFWDRTGTRLVPDLRYLPMTMTVASRPNEVVRRLLAGPSSWLKPAVVSFRSGTTVRTPVQSSDGRVVVNLPSQAVADTDKARESLMDQLRWSLRPYVDDQRVELQIENQTKTISSGSSYVERNVAAQDREPELFGVNKNGKVGLQSTSDPDPGPLSVLESKANASVKHAAISTDHSFGAFVQHRNGVDSLTVVTSAVDALLRESAVAPLRGLEIGRPAWISGTRGHLIVPASGRLYLVSSSGAARNITPYGISNIRAVSVAPDGRRIAFVAGTKVYVAAIVVDGPSMSLGSELRGVLPPPNPKHPKFIAAAASVAWASEDGLLVAGANPGTGDETAALFWVTADGAAAEDRSPVEQALIDVITFPVSPHPGNRNAGDVVAQTASNVLKLFRSGPASVPDLVSPFYAGG